jgi:hypothetical protein
VGQDSSGPCTVTSKIYRLGTKFILGSIINVEVTEMVQIRVAKKFLENKSRRNKWGGLDWDKF